MNLYYGLTNYHLLCSILHKMTYLPKEKAIFVASEGVLKDRIEDLKRIGIFDEIYYIEDKKMRDEKLNCLNEKSSAKEIENAAQKFIDEYSKMIPFDFHQIENYYMFADHGALGLYLLIKKQNYIYLEDAKGLYSHWKNLDKILEAKDPGMRMVALHYKAHGKSELAIKRYVDFNSQLKDYDLSKCIHFEVNALLDHISEEDLDKIFELFKVEKYNVNDKQKNVLVLTQRFSTYKLLTGEECAFMYALLCDIFAPEHKVFLKAHPGDKSDYHATFKDEIILNKEMPSELLRFIIDKKFDKGICTFSSSIYSLIPYIEEVYNIDDTVVEFKNKIFKLLVLFEFAKKFNLNVKYENDSLADCFAQYYKLKGNNYISFNSNIDDKANIIIKDKFFDKANIVIKWNQSIDENSDYTEIVKSEKLHVRVNSLELQNYIKYFQLNIKLPISKVQIDAKITE